MWHRLVAFLVFAVSVAASGTKYPPPPDADNPLVQIVGRELFVAGKPFFIKGVCYSPVPIGESPAFPPHGDYFTEQYAYIWMRDLPLLERMGATVLRIYGWDTTGTSDHTTFLNAVHEHGLKVMLTFWLGTSFWNPVSTPEQRQKIIDDFVHQVSLYANHPAILMWSFGNELNGPWNGFMEQFSIANGCNWGIACMYNMDPGSSCRWSSECVYNALFTFINDAAKGAHTVSTRPITSGFADVDFFVSTPWPNFVMDKIPRFEHLLSDLGAWALQLYRGQSFGNIFDNFQLESSKPILITEFGVDAFNDACGWPENQAEWVCFNMYMRDMYGGDQAMPGHPYVGCAYSDQPCARPGQDVQSEWDVDLARELMMHSPQHGGAVIGGFLMSWTDEYWKGSSVEAHCNIPCPIADADRCRGQDAGFYTGGGAQCNQKAHFTCNNYDNTYHDLCGYYLYAMPDHYCNEEWFGITTPTYCNVQGPAGGYHMDGLLIRPAYLAMQRLWKETGWDYQLSDLQVTCEMLKPCHECLMKFLPAQIAKGTCDTACKTRTTQKSKHPRPAWLASSFWNDYGNLMRATIIILSLSCIGLIYAEHLKRKRLRHLPSIPLY